MDPNKKKARAAERAMAKLAAQLQQAGVQLPEEVKGMDFKEAAREAQSKSLNNPSLEAEAVLQFLNKPTRYLLKTCKRKACEQPFGTSYHAVAYCSDACRIIELKERGITWNPHKRPEERWGGEPPLLISPVAINAMVNLLRKSRRHQLADEVQNQTENPSQENVEESVVSDEIPQVAPEYTANESTPVYHEVYSEQPEQSEVLPETDQLDVPAQEDNPGTNSSPEPPQSPTQSAKTEEDFVFDFE